MTAPLETVVVRGVRWKAALVCFGGLAFVALAVFMARDPRARTELGGLFTIWIGGPFFALCAFAGAAQVVRPVVLELTGEGFTVRSPLGRVSAVAWRDIARFKLWTIRSTSFVGYDYVEGRAPSGLLVQANRALGVDGALPKGLSLPPRRLLQLVERYRAVEAARRGEQGQPQSELQA